MIFVGSKVAWAESEFRCDDVRLRCEVAICD